MGTWKDQYYGFMNIFGIHDWRVLLSYFMNYIVCILKLKKEPLSECLKYETIWVIWLQYIIIIHMLQLYV